MNKNIKRLVSVLLAVLVLSALGVSALADGVPNSNVYTVTVSTGNMGFELVGESVRTAEYGKTLPLGSVNVPDDSPYYFKGFRPAGQDNNVVYPESIKVTEDMDYVAAYGLRGELVAYTVTYKDANGNDLEVDSEPHYGNVGDKIVVGARDIDGYEPQAYQLAKTLVEDASENVLPFVYTQIVVPTPVPAEPSPTPYVYTEGAEESGLPAGAGEVELPGAGGEAAVAGEEVPEGGAPEDAGEPEAAEQNAPEQEAAAEQEPETAQIDENDTPLHNGPAEYIDLDKSPTGDKPEIKEKPETELQQERSKSEHNLFISVGLLGVSLIAIVTLVVLLVKKRRA